MPAKPSQMTASLKKVPVKAHAAPSHTHSGVGRRGASPALPGGGVSWSR